MCSTPKLGIEKFTGPKTAPVRSERTVLPGQRRADCLSGQALPSKATLQVMSGAEDRPARSERTVLPGQRRADCLSGEALPSKATVLVMFGAEDRPARSERTVLPGQRRAHCLSGEDSALEGHGAGDEVRLDRPGYPSRLADPDHASAAAAATTFDHSSETISPAWGRPTGTVLPNAAVRDQSRTAGVNSRAAGTLTWLSRRQSRIQDGRTRCLRSETTTACEGRPPPGVPVQRPSRSGTTLGQQGPSTRSGATLIGPQAPAEPKPGRQGSIHARLTRWPGSTAVRVESRTADLSPCVSTSGCPALPEPEERSHRMFRSYGHFFLDPL